MDVEVVPFTVLVDQREQKPFQFRGLKAGSAQKQRPLVIPIQKAHLYTGDYSILGFEDRIAVERKSKSDLFFCMGKDRGRFEEQIRRLNEMQHAYVIVEAGYESILQGCSSSQLTPKTIMRTRISWEMKYPRVHWWMCPSVQFAEAQCFRIFECFWRHEQQK